VEDLFDLGDPVEVKVDDVDPQGKVSLSLAGDAPAPREGASTSDDADTDNGSDAERGSGDDAASGNGDRVVVSFEDEFEDELKSELGDLGPAPTGGGGDRGGRDRGGRNGGGR